MVGGVAINNDLHAGRKLLDYRIGFGFPEGTGSKTIQVRAAVGCSLPAAMVCPEMIDAKCDPLVSCN